jgi:dienelactone hydrolase
MDTLRESIGSFLKLSLPVAAPDVRIVGRESEDGYTRSLIRYSAEDGDQIEAFLFHPTRERPRGKVLALHQHNSQWMIGKSEIAGLAGDPLQAFGPALARLGVSVLAPDSIGFESRCTPPGWGTSLAPPLDRPYGSVDGWLQHYNHMAHRLVQGDLLMRKVLADCATALSALQNFEPTGAMPVGVLGHSYGGMLALFFAALDTRVAFACSSGAASSFRYKLAHRIGLEMSLIIPGFARRFDLEDLIRCVAPRRLLLVSSEDDPLTKDADHLLRAALPAFEALNCAGNLQHLRFHGSHALDQERFQAILQWTAAQSLREPAS